MSNDQLRLVATIDDRFTGPLAKLRKGLHDVSAETKAQAGAWKKDWDGARDGIAKFEGVLRGVTPVLSGLGVAGIGVGLSIAGAASAIGEFSSKTRNLSQVAKDVGLTIDQLRAFNALGERFGVTADTMTNAAKTFAGSMFEVKRQGSTFIELQAMNLGKLAEELASSKNMQQAWERGMEGLRNIPDAEVRRRVSRLLFGTDDVGLIASNVTGTISGAMKEVSESIGKMDKETEEAAKNFQKHMNHISEAAERAKLKFIGPLLEGMVGVIDSIENAAKNPEAAKLKMLRDSRADADKAAQSAPWPLKGYFERQRDSIDAEIRKLEDATRKGTRDGLKDALREQQNGGATFQQQSYGGGPAGGGSLIQKAAWGGFGGPLGMPSGPLGGGYGTGVGVGAGPLAGQSLDGPLAPRIAPRAPRPNGDGGQQGSATRTDGPLTARYPDGLAAGIRQSAKDLGVSAEDIATAISYETGGTFDKWKRGPTTKWGTHRGLIQWGEPQARKYGVTSDMSAGEQMKAVTRYLRDAGVKPGMGILDIYSAINAGRVGRYNASDAAAGGAWGTVRDKVEHQMHRHRRKASALLRADGKDEVASGDASGLNADVPWHQRPRSNEPGKMSRLRNDEIETPGSGERPGDRMMRRFYGEGAPVARGGKGSLHITLDGFPPGAKARASMDDLFKETKVERSRSQMDMQSI